MSDLTITPMDAAAAEETTGWRYPPPYDIYDLDEEPAKLIAIFSDPAYGYFQLREGGALVGFCCFGEEGRVRGGDYAAPALDLGIAMRPDLTGRGLGRRYLGAILTFAESQFRPPALRLTVAAFNARARRLYANLGFRSAQRFNSPASGREYIVMLRPTAAPG
ncbi:GNAT family N-acetyltransferase [Oscillochloris sp. ZM17-4]|uniref:GNAT family N-acetyltransferase n=1 Tax=Oscillochloris sp. ZM17-4 TaxID=2866714 RepID=UPI001C72DB65|nr:GNAT family N-acetyltransferase [Oscillochloris sp. ZM17-4]MBX0329180.1 GNAT family N-acetyltransferase [Oscillochloris sp. ZM17-4]